MCASLQNQKYENFWNVSNPNASFGQSYSSEQHILQKNNERERIYKMHQHHNLNLQSKQHFLYDIYIRAIYSTN